MSSNLEGILFRDVFTIPIEVDDFDDNGAAVKTKMMVTYHFGEDNKDIFTPKEGVTFREQFVGLVRKIEGVDSPIDASFGAKLRPKYATAVVKAIFSDIFPNE